jgi:hypothetical protein
LPENLLCSGRCSPTSNHFPANKAIGHSRDRDCAFRQITPEVADFRKETGTRRDIGFITSQRVALYSGAVVLGYLLGLMVRVVARQPWRGPDNKACTDFIWMWLRS